MKETHEILRGESPRYLQLYERLRQDITDGVYPFGSRFPSKRVLADRYAVSLITVERSLSLLISEGYLESRERSGFFVSFREQDLFIPEASHSQPASEPVHSDGTASFPFSVYARTLRRVLADYGENVLRRVPNSGEPGLKQAICDYLARSRGIRVVPEQLVIGAGSEYLYSLIAQFFGRDHVFAIEEPSYKKIEQVYTACSQPLVHLPLGTDGIRSDALASCRAHVIHITPYRSFPSGISTNAAKRREYIRWADRHEAFLVEDDYESEFTPSSKPEETLFSLADRDNVLYLNSFSRTIGPGLRISYLLLPRQLCGAFQKKLGFYACPVPAFEQYVLAEFIRSGEFERHLNRERRRRRDG